MLEFAHERSPRRPNSRKTMSRGALKHVNSEGSVSQVEMLSSHAGTTLEMTIFLILPKTLSS
jgi:hypothetical protein